MKPRTSAAISLGAGHILPVSFRLGRGWLRRIHAEVVFCPLPSAYVRTAVHTQHLPGDLTRIR
jgi:hypothetical protein